jgi:hypothetical protein
MIIKMPSGALNTAIMSRSQILRTVMKASLKIWIIRRISQMAQEMLNQRMVM